MEEKEFDVACELCLEIMKEIQVAQSATRSDSTKVTGKRYK